jgi:hypothetical protein
MRFKLVFLAVLASLVAVSAAAGKGKPPGTGDGCKPNVKVVLKGVLAPDVDPADGDVSFVMVVKHSNRFGRAWKQAGSATVNVDQKTKIRRKGARNLGALAPNDRVQVGAKVCKADLANGAMPDLTARRIGAHPAKTS